CKAAISCWPGRRQLCGRGNARGAGRAKAGFFSASASARARTRANDLGEEQRPAFARAAEPRIVLIGTQVSGSTWDGAVNSLSLCEGANGTLPAARAPLPLDGRTQEPYARRARDQ